MQDRTDLSEEGSVLWLGLSSYRQEECLHVCHLQPVQTHQGNSSVTHVTFFQFFYFHRATIKHLVVQSIKFKAYDDLGVQFYITT